MSKVGPSYMKLWIIFKYKLVGEFTIKEGKRGGRYKIKFNCLRDAFLEDHCDYINNVKLLLKLRYGGLHNFYHI